MILNEGSRDKLLEPYLNLLNSRGIECDLSQLKRALLAKFVNEANIRSLSLDSNYYLAGVARYYFEGELTVNKNVNMLYPQIKDVFIDEVCQRVSGLISFFRNAYIDSVGTEFVQPENFGELSLKAILRKYKKDIDKELGIESSAKKKEPKPDTLDRSENVGNGYTFEILYHYEDARKYRQYTEPSAWCITYGEQHYNRYVRKLGIHYVIFKKNGFENIPRRKGVNFTPEKPQDEYGSSLIAVLQKNSSWEPSYITSRWNHGSAEDNSFCEADHAFTTEDFIRVTGVSQEDLQRIFNIWKRDREVTDKQISVNRKELNRKRLNTLRIFKYAQMRINGGNFATAFGEYEPKVFNLLSGCEKANSIRGMAKGLTDKGEIEALDKQFQKHLLKNIRSYSIKIEDNIYYFLMDGNKILFETIIEPDGPFDSPDYHFKTSDKGFQSRDWTPAQNLNNIIWCYVLNGIMLYDYRTHSFVNVGGTKKFKYVTDVSNGDVARLTEGMTAFYEVKLAESQGALIDLVTNRPLQLPNGDFWYEGLYIYEKKNYTYSRNVETNFIQQKNNAIYIVYDRASGESYLYDLNVRKFVELPVLEGDYKINNTNPFGDCGYLGGAYAIEVRNKGDYYQNTRYFLYKNGEPFEINGYNSFYKITYIGNGFYFFKVNEDDVKFTLYNIIENKQYNTPNDLNGLAEYETGIKRQYGNIECNPPLVLFYIGKGMDSAYAFSTVDKKFLKNPISGDYLLDVYGVGYQNCTVIVFNNEIEKKRYCLRLVNGELEAEGIANRQVYQEYRNDTLKSIIKNLVLENLKKYFRND